MAESAMAENEIPEALRSIHVKPDTMPWRETSFEGVQVKPLYVNRETGVLTALMRMAPGAVLPDQSR